MPPLVVEGLTDAVFFSELARHYLPEVAIEYMDQPGKRRIPASVRGLRVDGSELELDFRNQDPETGGGKERIPEAITALIRGAGVIQLIVAQDLNGDSPGAVLARTKSLVSTLLGGQAPDVTDFKFQVKDVNILVIPMGLHDDPDLKALGITRHEMEDYLIKLLLLDATLTSEVPRLRQLIEELIETMRRYDVPVVSSKDLFQLLKPVIKRGYSDTAVVESLFRNADPAVLDSVMTPLIEGLELATDP